jgi:hypothetical protein
MKTNGKHEVVARIARRGLLLAALVAVVLSAAGISRAQSNPPASAPARSATAGQVQVLQSTDSVSTPKTGDPGTPTAAREGQNSRGKNEGIKIHGYWKIDVRDPDGKLVSHTEFENALTTSDPNGLSGDFFLAKSLAGSLASVQTASKVTIATADIIALQIGVNTNGLSPGALNNTVNVLPTGPCGGQGCLVPTTVVSSPPANQVTLSSTFTSTSTTPFTITEVGTFVNLVRATVSTAGSFTTLDRGASNSLTSHSLGIPPNCGTTPQSPCAVSVSPNQMVSVTVALSFQ